MSKAEESVHQFEIILSPEGTVAFTQHLVSALQLRLESNQDAKRLLPLKERLAWMDLLKTIDRGSLGEAAIDIDNLIDFLLSDERQSTLLDLGRLANL